MAYDIFVCDKIPSHYKDKVDALLKECSLRNEEDAEYNVLVFDDSSELLACGALKGNILKQIAVSPAAEGEGLCATVVTELIGIAVNRGITQLFLFTKPKHKPLFMSLGFYPIIVTQDILMMENRPGGLEAFLRTVPHYSGRVGAVVCNCNPFTLGHRKLIEQAAAQTDHLLVFVLSEEQPMFPAEDRLTLVRDGTADLENVTVISGGKYMISRATFPTYFIKEECRCQSASCELDVRLFAERIAPALNISVRFVGEEPFDPITREYNEMLKALLPLYNIELIEVPRFGGISATAVRRMIREGRISETKDSLPEVTYEYCKRRFTAGSEFSR